MGKKVLLLQVVVFFLMVGSAFAEKNDFTIRECEDVRYTYVRYGSSYTFYHELTNSSASPVYLLDKQVGIIDAGHNVVKPWELNDLIQRGSSFEWTAELKEDGFAVSPNETLRTIKTGPAEWHFNKHPEKRHNLSNNEYDILIQYQVTYAPRKNAGETTSENMRTACNYYATTWCGDGYLDTEFLNDENIVSSEQCDDGNNVNGDGCSANCTLEYQFGDLALN